MIPYYPKLSRMATFIHTNPREAIRLDGGGAGNTSCVSRHCNGLALSLDFVVHLTSALDDSTQISAARYRGFQKFVESEETYP